jgi:hypothetical protein
MSSFCKATKGLYTGNSSDLGVMSPQSETARCRCAMPISSCCVFGPLAMTTSFCKAGELEYMPAVCFDHTSSPL